MNGNGYRIAGYPDSGVSFEHLKVAVERLDNYMPWSFTNVQEGLDHYVRKLVHYACIDLALSSDGRIVGILAYYANDKAASRAFITFFCVEPELWGSGIARLMMERMTDTARKNGMTTIELRVAKSNLRAQAFYRKSGFAIASEISEKEFLMSGYL